MSGRPRRRLVLFIVEGRSEIDALQVPFGNLFDEIDDTIEIDFCQIRDENQKGGDITSKYGVFPEKIEELIEKIIIMPYLNDNGLYPKDIEEIIQIVDLDGAFLQDESIVLSKGERIIYSSDTIETDKVDSIIERNKRKRKNLDFLVSREAIKIRSKEIKYSVFFFSSNLDHFLHNNANLEPASKRKCAEEFSNKCLANSNYIVDFFCNDQESMGEMGYLQSWAYIRAENNSIHRHTNLDFLVDRLALQLICDNK